MNTSATAKRSLSDTAATIGDLFDQGMRLSLDLLESLSASSISTLNRMISPSSLGELLPKLTATTAPMAGCGCRIPPPCWAPQPIGDVACHICPGGTATIRLRITNCGATRRDIKVEAAGKAAGVAITPSNLALGPIERGFVSAALPIPADATIGQAYEVLLWVRGCHDHYLRWTVNVASRGASCCQEVEVDDCPDLIHHWYDHFYCERPCVH